MTRPHCRAGDKCVCRDGVPHGCPNWRQAPVRWRVHPDTGLPTSPGHPWNRERTPQKPVDGS
jgi:hypothetical protein